MKIVVAEGKRRQLEPAQQGGGFPAAPHALNLQSAQFALARPYPAGLETNGPSDRLCAVVRRQAERHVDFAVFPRNDDGW